jgi:hypothetical protein
MTWGCMKILKIYSRFSENSNSRQKKKNEMKMKRRDASYQALTSFCVAQFIFTEKSLKISPCYFSLEILEIYCDKNL